MAQAPPEAPPVGALLRDWRRRRRLSQLDLAAEAEVSQRHLSFVETGRSSPSREMILRLAEHLSVPLRDRSALLAAAGFAPRLVERGLDDPALAPARRAVELILTAHEPYPALAVDRRWTLVLANDAALRLMAGVSAALLRPPVNVLRLSLHPDGLAARIANFREWRAHVVARLARQIDASGDAALVDLLAELKTYPPPPGARPHRPPREDALGGIAVPLELEVEGATLSLLSATTVFGTPVDVTLSELCVESFFPADAATAQALRRGMAGAADRRT
jgi:transcriptional regulator with XRE-family HTH domain